MPEAPCVCRVDGDPRVTTFDGSALLIGGVGIYLLLKTELPKWGQRFLLAVETVQAAPGQYPGLLSINRIYFKAESRLTVIERNSIQIDNLTLTVLPSTVGDVTVSGVIGDHVRISHSTGYYVTAKFGQTAQDTHIICNMGTSALHSPIGLCGNCDSIPADEFVVDSKDLSKDPDRYQKISRAHLRDLTFILSN